MDSDSCTLPKRVNGRFERTSQNLIIKFIHSVRLSSMTALVGTNDLKKGGLRYKIDKMIKHDGYRLGKDDIGLVRVEGSIEFSNLVKKITFMKEELLPSSTLELCKPNLQIH